MLRKDKLKPFGSSADPLEIDRFNRLAEEWWRPDGLFKVIHSFNDMRVQYLADTLPRILGRPQEKWVSLAGLRLLDAGCGAGLVSEPMARLGAEVVGIDASEQNIKMASLHAIKAGIDITYKHTLPENLDPMLDGVFDIVLSLEVIEHVADLETFFSALSRLVKPQGCLVIGTLNRTLGSYIKAILGAEYILGLLPRGTHNWRKFVQPGELDDYLKPLGFSRIENCGLTFNPILRNWKTTKDLSVNYLQLYKKQMV